MKVLSRIAAINWNLVIIAVLLVGAAAVAIWMESSRTGRISGVVLVEQTREPVAGAMVSLSEKTLNAIKEPRVVRTAADGTFVYNDVYIVEFIIRAEGPQGRRSTEEQYHLYFPGQDFELPSPLLVQ